MIRATKDQYARAFAHSLSRKWWDSAMERQTPSGERPRYRCVFGCIRCGASLL